MNQKEKQERIRELQLDCDPDKVYSLRLDSLYHWPVSEYEYGSFASEGMKLIRDDNIKSVNSRGVRLVVYKRGNNSE